jgi:putative oxidoreductase
MSSYSFRSLISSAPIHRCAGMFILRLVIGGIFLYAGYYKLAHMDQAIAGFASMGFSTFWVWVVAIVELLGGVAFILGTFTRLAGALFSIIMLVVIFKVKWTAGFMVWQPDLVLLAGSLAVMFAGAGKYGICPTRKECGACNTDACKCK